jgi:hypothetical protein
MPQKHKATVPDSTLRVEMNNLEEQAGEGGAPTFRPLQHKLNRLNLPGNLVSSCIFLKITPSALRERLRAYPGAADLEIHVYYDIDVAFISVPKSQASLWG